MKLKPVDILAEFMEYPHIYSVLGPQEYEVVNPFEILYRDKFYEKNPHVAMVALFTNPDYLSYTCKVLLNINIAPFQSAVLKELWTRPFPMLIGSRGCSKTFTLALYALLKALLVPKSRIVICGAAFRQSKLVYDYMCRVFDESPILKDIIGIGPRQGPKRDIDRCNFYVGDSEVTALPVGDGSKIRGLRATDIIADEFASMRKDIYEEVIGGFAAVSASPVEAHSEWAKIELLKKIGHWSEDDEKNYMPRRSNKSIISGTASFEFNHFYEYYMQYKKIIESRGDVTKLKDILGPDADLSSFDYRDYSIIRIPIEVLPRKFMDEKIVNRARATTDRGIFMSEFGAVFPKDTAGFFKRSLIESCVATDLKPVVVSSGEPVWFDPLLKGDPTKKYIMAIDPASEQDNFAISILEIWPDHRRVVYCWTMNRKEHKRRITAGTAVYHDYYSFCGRKIRDLMKVFSIERVVVDMGGGGIAVCETLRDRDKLQPGEQLLWPVINYDKPQDTDDNLGLHIIVPFQFANYENVKDANYGLLRDMQEQIILFPRFDPISIELAIEQDKILGREIDTFEDVVMEIEEMKNELATIVVTKTHSQARERWDTPEIKLAGNKKGNLQKDRYSSLIMGNWVARTLYRIDQKAPYSFCGSLANPDSKPNGQLYSGPDWFANSEYARSYSTNM